MLLNDCLKEYLYECQIRQYTWKTIKGYRNGLEFLMNYLMQEHDLKNIEEVQTKHLKAFFMYQSKRGRKETYLNGLLKAYRAFFKYVIDEEYISDNPILKVNWMKEEKSIIQTFSDNEVKRMIDTYQGNDFISIRNKAIIAMLFDTGIRCYELCTLTNECIRDDHIVIFGKGKKERRVGKSPYLAKILMKYERVKQFNFEYRNIKSDNKALLVVEKASAGHTVIDKLKNDFQYTNMYKYKEYDARGKAKKKVGYITNGKTKPIMINDFVELFETKQICIKSKDLLSEMKLFAFKNGKMEAITGNHDDLVMAFAMALVGIKSGLNYIGSVKLT